MSAGKVTGRDTARTFRAGLAVSAFTERPYQTAALDAIEAEFQAGRRSTLINMATGTGKAVIIATATKRYIEQGQQALVLAPRVEILEQLRSKLVACGVRAEIEQGERRAGSAAECVVASVASLRGPRLERFAPDRFGLVVLDECHHGVSDSWMAVLARFPAAKVLGCTATADRLDGQGLGKIFESVAFTYGLRQAVRDKWLCPIRARRVVVDGLDLAGVHVRAGDLDRAELAEQMTAESALHGVAVPLLELAGDRPTVVFAVNVAHAHALTEVINRYRPGHARAVDGAMPAKVRASILADFADRRFGVLANVGLLCEGWDMPAVSCVAMARPTKSRGLYVQCIGRATRLAVGKLDALILDFVGNSGRHRLVGPADVLADRELPDDVRDEISALLDGDHGDLENILELAEATAADERRKAAITAVARYRAEEIDPFLGDLPDAPRATWAGDLASDAQRDALARQGLDDLPGELTKGEASRWLDAIAARRSAGLATVRQVRLLKRYGLDARALAIGAANAVIDRIKANGWKRWAA